MLVVLVGGAIALGQTGSALNRLETDSLTPLTAAAQARIRGNDAKANESLTLISRGSGAAFEQSWKDSAAQVQSALTTVDVTDLTSRWAAYAQVHTEIRTLDDGGSWDKAVALATGTGDGSSNATFGAFDPAAIKVVDRLADDLGSGLRGATDRHDRGRRPGPRRRRGRRLVRSPRTRPPAAGVPMRRAPFRRPGAAAAGRRARRRGRHPGHRVLAGRLPGDPAAHARPRPRRPPAARPPHRRPVTTRSPRTRRPAISRAAGDHAVGIDDAQDPESRPADRRGLGRHATCSVPATR